MRNAIFVTNVILTRLLTSLIMSLNPATDNKMKNGIIGIAYLPNLRIAGSFTQYINKNTKINKIYKVF
jgi:hypothetical protein